MLQMVAAHRRPRPAPNWAAPAPARAPATRATDPALLVARMLFVSGRVHEADEVLSALSASARGPEALRIEVHVKHALGALTEALDALELHVATQHRGGLRHDSFQPAGPPTRQDVRGLDLDLPELLVAASHHFLPFDALAPLVPSGVDLGAARDRVCAARDTASALGDPGGASMWATQLGLLEALRGAHAASEVIWRDLMLSPHARPLHAKYFAAVRAAAGDDEGAQALYVAALAEEPAAADPEVLALVLPHADEARVRLLAQVLGAPQRRGPTVARLRACARRDPSRPEPWRLLARFFRAVRDHAQAERLQAKADQLEQHRAATDVGKVKSAAAYVHSGGQHGFVHDIWVSRTPAAQGGLAVLGNIAPDMQEDIDNAYEAARKFVQETFPHLAQDLDDYRYTLKVTKDDRPSDGHSAGAAVTLAFVSRFLGLPVPQDVAITGRLVVDSASRLRVAAVGAVDAKAIGTHHRGLRTLFAPAENRGSVLASALAPGAQIEPLVTYVSDFGELLAQVFGESVWEL